MTFTIVYAIPGYLPTCHLYHDRARSRWEAARQGYDWYLELLRQPILTWGTANKGSSLYGPHRTVRFTNLYSWRTRQTYHVAHSKRFIEWRTSDFNACPRCRHKMNRQLHEIHDRQQTVGLMARKARSPPILAQTRNCAVYPSLDSAMEASPATTPRSPTKAELEGEEAINPSRNRTAATSVNITPRRPPSETYVTQEINRLHGRRFVPTTEVLSGVATRLQHVTDDDDPDIVDIGVPLLRTREHAPSVKQSGRAPQTFVFSPGNSAPPSTMPSGATTPIHHHLANESDDEVAPDIAPSAPSWVMTREARATEDSSDNGAMTDDQIYFTNQRIPLDSFLRQEHPSDLVGELNRQMAITPLPPTTSSASSTTDISRRRMPETVDIPSAIGHNLLMPTAVLRMKVSSHKEKDVHAVTFDMMHFDANGYLIRQPVWRRSLAIAGIYLRGNQNVGGCGLWAASTFCTVYGAKYWRRFN